MRTLAAASIVIVLAACGGDDGGGVPRDQLAGRLAASLCANIFRCREPTERSYATEAERLAELTAFFQDGYDDLDAAIAAGRLGYDGDGAADCIVALDAAACGFATRDAAEACVLFYGRVALGGTCTSAVECAGGAFCDGDACVTPPTAGMECIGEACGAGAFCETQPPPSPILYLCVAKKADGMPCAARGECVSDYCDFSTNTCAAEPAPTGCDGL